MASYSYWAYLVTTLSSNCWKVSVDYLILRCIKIIWLVGLKMDIFKRTFLMESRWNCYVNKGCLSLLSVSANEWRGWLQDFLVLIHFKQGFQMHICRHSRISIGSTPGRSAIEIRIILPILLQLMTLQIVTASCKLRSAWVILTNTKSQFLKVYLI